MNAKRITPAEVVEAFKKTGFGVHRGNYFNRDNTCACGLGVMYAVKFEKKPGMGLRFDPEQFRDFSSDYSRAYTRAFALGFDGKEMPAYVEMEFLEDGQLIEAMVGYQDGIDAWNAVMEEYAV